MKPEAVLKYAHVPVAMLGGLWEALRREWSEREGVPPAGVHHRVQRHRTRQGRPPVARRGQGAGGDSAGPHRRTAQHGRRHPHHPGGFQGRARARRRESEVRRGPVDAPDAGYGREDRLAAGHAATAHLPGRLRSAGEEARTPPSSAGPRRTVHRQRRDADRGLGLQHRHPHRGASPIHVPASLRAGGGSRASPLELCGVGGREARRGGGEDLRGSVRGGAAEGEPSGQRATPAPEDLADPRTSGQGRSRDSVPSRRTLHAEGSAPLEGRLGQHRPAPPRPDGHPARGGRWR